MITTYGYAALQPKSPLEPYSFERRDLRENDVNIKILYCGICHSDIHQVRDEWKNSPFPMVPGHEIIGIISKIGKKVTSFNVGDSVGVGCIVDSCRRCECCQKGLEQYCLEGFTGTYNGIDRIDKTYTQGGYSDQIVVDEQYVLKIPKNLPLHQAAPLLCAGITVYSPLMHWKAGPNKKVAILGLGGLGHMGVKLARALGAEVSVFSHTASKQEDAMKLGANHFYCTTDSSLMKKLKGSFDLIINTISAALDWNEYLKLLKLEGSMVMVGIPEKPNLISSISLISGRKNLSGSWIGGIQETQEMLNFCAQHNIVSEIELIPAQKINEAYERVLKSDVRYRFVIDMSSLKNK